MVAFIDDHKAAYGVEPICDVLPIAPSTYYARKAQARDPALMSARAQSDAWLRSEIRRVWETNFQVCGARKVWKQLRRQDVAVARCTVTRLMREMGLRGAVFSSPGEVREALLSRVGNLLEFCSSRSRARSSRRASRSSSFFITKSFQADG